MTGNETPHVHRWLRLPVVNASYSWSCEDPSCREGITEPWCAEWAGLGFEDMERIVAAKRGGVMTGRPLIPEPARSEAVDEFFRRVNEGQPGASTALEARVAALEERLAHPLTDVSAKMPALTDEQAEELRARLDKALGDANFRYTVLPQRPLLTPETARELLRECVTVVQPGEVLAVRVPENWNAQQVYECQRYLNEAIEYRELGIAVLLLPGEEFAVAKTGDAA